MSQEKGKSVFRNHTLNLLVRICQICKAGLKSRYVAQDKLQIFVKMKTV